MDYSADSSHKFNFSSLKNWAWKKNHKLCFLIGNRYWSKSIKYFLILFEFQNWIIFFWITVVELSHCRVWKRVSLVFVSPFQIRFFLSKTPRPSHHHHTYQLHAADGCNNSKFRLYEKATYQRGVRNSRLGVKNSSFFVEHHFSHNCKKKHFSTTANSVYLDSNRIWKKVCRWGPKWVEIYLEQFCWFFSW